MGLFSSPPKPKRSSLKRLAIVAPIYALAGTVAGIVGLMIYYSVIYPDPLTLRRKDNAPLVRILARDGTIISERGGGDDYVPLDLLPHYVTDAVIATEDQRFYDHHGVDPWGMVRAAFINLREGRTVQGGSTLTQQLAKNLYLSHDRTLSRKLEEFTLALWLESRLSKADILELYLNRVYLGSGAYGIDAASRRYFSKPARSLTLAEAAMIAGLLKAPSKFSPLSNPGLARSRAKLVLSQMQEAGFITEDQERQASDEVSRSFERSQNAKPAGADYAVDFVMDQLAPVYVMAVAGGAEGLIVETTLDRHMQANASAIVEQFVDQRGPTLQAGEAAAVVLDRDGALLAMVGGRSYAETQFNRAAKAMRQPGSAFKPFVYLAALEAGYTPDSVVEDLPLSVGGWAPRNDNGEYLGPMPLRTALAKSVNTVAARLTVQVGPARVAHVAKRLGIRSPLAKDATLSLGTSEVSLLELTGAYNVIANGGRAVEPYAVRRVRTFAGDVLFARQAPVAAQVLAPEKVVAINDMLSTALNEGTGRRAAIPMHAAAGKTGTSQGFRDAWFIGYTGYLTTGVWAGNDDGSGMNRVVGGSLPAEIWREIMIGAHAGKPPVPLAGGEPSRVAEPLRGYPAEPIADDFIARALLEQQQPPSETGSVEQLLAR
ncbi:PBP1A family penicillin-binding protein [Hyphomicrobium sp. xq]|uniref:PBP1A family penicillin-binding protein n=1 Tax=Hyphomicrobium album TaxID=2665159 RepID=A0A6I3KL04_9HYPH|nr:PBP1A family penicillin-binding protein [Hyphomicrobium album]MTD95149.1 PBP1A family penicillin-binding protein [Hyphomicrobium album]